MMMIVLVLVVCYTSFAIGDQSEPKCYSRFDYDEKMLMKLLKIEDQVQKFGNIIKEMKSAHDAEALERLRLFTAELEAFKVVNAESVQTRNNQTAEIQITLDTANAMLTGLQKSENETSETAPGSVVAFTVTNPVTGPQSDLLSFSTVVMNEGNSFDKTTGEFKCPVSGVYYFTVHIVKKRSASVDTAGCYIHVNESSVVRAYIDPQDGASGADTGSYGVSNSVYVRLAVNDIVKLGGCSGDGSLESWSSFSGYLAKAGSLK